MTVGVHVDRAVRMQMGVKMHAITPQPPKHMRAKANQHDPDARLDWPRKCFRDRVAQQDGDAGKGQQSEGVAEPPRQAMFDNVANFSAARRNRGDRGDMVGLERVLHSQQKTQPQNSEHARPAPYSLRHPPTAEPAMRSSPRREFLNLAGDFAEHSSHIFESAGKDRKGGTSAACSEAADQRSPFFRRCARAESHLETSEPASRL